MQPENMALITGASSGIGAAFARQLAARGYNLLLVARRVERLAALAGELTQAHPIKAEIQVVDLADPAAVGRLTGRVASLETLTLLVNNAGFGTTGRFAKIDLTGQLDMIHVHVLATVRLTRAALPGMIARDRGAIINVSSMAGFVPLPGNVTYCATKAYLTSFSQALQVELAGTGVQVQALCPGFTHTEFHGAMTAGHYDHARIPGWMWLPADEVVATSLRALERGRVVVIPGLRYRLLAALIHLAPVAWQQWIFQQQYRR
jgi:short-subunit dehydrogenase